MSAEGIRLPSQLPPMHPFLNHCSEWMGKMVAPLNASLLSKDGILEVAVRVKYIVFVVIVSLIAIAIKYSSSRTSPPPSPGPAGGDSSAVQSLPGMKVPVVPPIPAPITPAGDSNRVAPPLPGPTGGDGKAIQPLSGIRAPAETSHRVALLLPVPTLLTDSLSLGSGFNPAARPTVETLRGTIEADVEKIHQNFDRCLQNMQACKPGSPRFQELIVDFKRKIANFRNVYGPYERTFDSTCFSAVKGYEMFLTDLNDILRGIIRVKGDGNCLFHSFVEAFKRLQPYLMQAKVWDERLLDHQILRWSVNQYMQNNIMSDADLRRLIDDAIIAHVEARREDIPLQKESELYKLASAEQLKVEGFAIDEEAARLALERLEKEEASLVDFEGPKKYEIYFSKFQELGFFAAFAAAYAMCKILNEKIGIRVAVEPERQITAEYDAFNVKAPILITLIFKRDHFDVKFPEGFLY